MSELKPCPFCGGNASAGGFYGSFYVRCLDGDCWASQHGSVWLDETSAIAAWNRRAPDRQRDEARAEVERLREAAIAACDKFDGPPSDSDFCNGQATAAQQIRAAILAALNTPTRNT